MGNLIINRIANSDRMDSSITKTACVVFVQGCPRSLMDAAKFVTYLRVNGWEVINDFKKADLILFGGCAFSSVPEQKSLDYLTIACNRKRKDARLVTFGCIAGIKEEIINTNYDAIAVNRRNINNLDDLIEARVKLKEIKDQNITDSVIQDGTTMFSKYDQMVVRARLSLKHGGKALFRVLFHNPEPPETQYERMFNIRVAQGCNARCTYCAIKNAIGPLHSKPLDEIAEEFNLAIRKGYKTIRLVADDVGSYGQDNGSNIVELLSRVFASQAHFKLLWDDFHPIWLVKYFKELLKIISLNQQRIGYLGFPIQSGSDKILGLMKRGYQTADVKECLLTLKHSFPEVSITTHMIVGFPGATREDFRQTVTFLEEINFKHFYAYRYCARPNTKALLLPGEVSEITKYARIWQLKRRFYDTCFIG
jgi:ribosomal protein S12 methylthiotransferase